MMNYLFNDFSYDKRSKYNPSEQLFYHVVDKIISYQVIPNEAFPSFHELAALLKLDPSDVQLTYDRLVKEKYCGPISNSIGVIMTTFVNRLNLGNVMNVEESLTHHNLDPVIQVMTNVSNPLTKFFQDWMLIPKQLKRRELHRLHSGKEIPFFYSVISMDPAYLSIHCKDCNSFDELIADWSTDASVEWTTMVLLTLSLPEPLAKVFRVLEGTSAFALRSSALNNNGMMLATVMYVFTPRMFFHTDLKIRS